MIDVRGRQRRVERLGNRRVANALGIAKVAAPRAERLAEARQPLNRINVLFDASVRELPIGTLLAGFAGLGRHFDQAQMPQAVTRLFLPGLRACALP